MDMWIFSRILALPKWVVDIHFAFESHSFHVIVFLLALQSRARQEDPEQLRLKQKAKEVEREENSQLVPGSLCFCAVCLMSILVSVCCPDAAAGACSVETQGGQLNSSGCHWSQEEEEDSGFSIFLCCSWGNAGLSLFPVYCCLTWESCQACGSFSLKMQVGLC